MKKTLFILVASMMLLATGCKKDASWFNGTSWKGNDSGAIFTLHFTSETQCLFNIDWGDGDIVTGTYWYNYSSNSFTFNWTKNEDDFMDGFMNCTGTYSNKAKTITFYNENGYPLILTKQ